MQDKFYLVYPTAVGDPTYLVFIKEIKLFIARGGRRSG